MRLGYNDPEERPQCVPTSSRDTERFLPPIQRDASPSIVSEEPAVSPRKKNAAKKEETRSRLGSTMMDTVSQSSQMNCSLSSSGSPTKLPSIDRHYAPSISSISSCRSGGRPVNHSGPNSHHSCRSPNQPWEEFSDDEDVSPPMFDVINENMSLKLPDIFKLDNASSVGSFTPRSVTSLTVKPLSTINGQLELDDVTENNHTKKKRKPNKRMKSKRDENFKMSKLSSDSAAKLESTIKKHTNKQNDPNEATPRANELSKGHTVWREGDEMATSCRQQSGVARYYDEGNVIEQIARENGALVQP
ncbi:hypothetical protein CAPTEDRAFT_196842 [Capitella teleta]|uniref:Uncharacterized protein n=1 Tax=Capitella teleta TaxID=283909 RepID=R7VH29_CAPTE|nr:hypothetical protein CAPTEDRAFT_196842 [Capitella teleta]|eukprot:ELU17919.1 hypothetical protein CAPTEDRAFT_196842 [Capitella teleta]